MIACRQDAFLPGITKDAHPMPASRGCAILSGIYHPGAKLMGFLRQGFCFQRVAIPAAPLPAAQAATGGWCCDRPGSEDVGFAGGILAFLMAADAAGADG